MATLLRKQQLRYNTINEHNKLIQELDLKYMNHIHALLQQKLLIQSQFQDALSTALDKIDSIHDHQLNNLNTIKSKEIDRKKTNNNDHHHPFSLPKIPSTIPIPTLSTPNSTPAPMKMSPVTNMNIPALPKLSSMPSFSTNPAPPSLTTPTPILTTPTPSNSNSLPQILPFPPIISSTNNMISSSHSHPNRNHFPINHNNHNNHHNHNNHNNHNGGGGGFNHNSLPLLQQHGVISANPNRNSNAFSDETHIHNNNDNIQQHQQQMSHNNSMTNSEEMLSTTNITNHHHEHHMVMPLIGDTDSLKSKPSSHSNSDTNCNGNNANNPPSITIKKDDNNNCKLATNRNKRSISALFTCICGEKLQEIKQTTKEYTQQYGTIFCDICNEKCKRRQPFYHCERGKNASQHPEGFDICLDCAYQQFQEIKPKLESGNGGPHKIEIAIKNGININNKNKNNDDNDIDITMPCIDLSRNVKIKRNKRMINNSINNPISNPINKATTTKKSGNSNGTRNGVVKSVSINGNDLDINKSNNLKKGISPSVSQWKCWYPSCNFSGDSKKCLDEHILNHGANKRPWQCMSCDKSFIEHEHLVIHSQSHQYKNMFHCSKCSFKTYKKSELNEHSRFHAGEKPVVCQYCFKQYVSNVTLQTHIKQFHKNGHNIKH